MNPILEYFDTIRPQLRDAPDWEKAAFVLSHALNYANMHGKCLNGTSDVDVDRIREHCEWNTVCEALAELCPDMKEFWFRCEATWNTQVLEAMTHAYTEKP